MSNATSSKSRFRQFVAEEYKPGKVESKTTGNEDPPEHAAKYDRKKFMQAYMEWLQPHRAEIIFVFILALLGMALGMVLPLATRHIIDGVLMVESLSSEEKIQQLHLVCAGVLVLVIFSEVFSTFRSIRMAVLNARVMFSLRAKLFDRLIALPLGQISELKTGGIVSRLSSDVESVRGLIQMAIVSPGVACLQIILTLGVLFWMQWELALVAALFVPPLAIVSYWWVRKVRPVYRSMSKDRTHVDGRVSETFGGIRVVRSFRREKKEEMDYALGHHTIIRKNILATINENIVGAGWGLLIPLAALIIVWFGGYLYIRDMTTIGDIVAFQMYSAMILNPVWRIINSVSMTQRALAAMDRVFEVLEREPDKPDHAQSVPAPANVEEIRLTGVYFSYKKEEPVLKDINLNIKGGSTIALVGASGAGKTTLTDLIARFYDPDRGSITLNGTDLRNIQLQSFRDLLGVVQQEVFLFDGTVMENIAYGNPKASLNQVVDAAKRANAHEFIDAFDKKYNTLIGERGVKLSGGQRQRISIARAILANPQILILDEATSNLDSESEQHIQTALRELFTGRTTIVIAHRLSTITFADQIVVLADGQIVEQGTHNTLLAEKGHYYRMVERQRSAFNL